VMIGQPMQGDWMLRVSDRAAQDVGTLRTWKLELSSNPAGLLADHVTIG
jgi:subtilisin-like proprotein convertase family protein